MIWRLTPPPPCRKTVTDPDKECPFHNKPHFLRKCQTFRSKPLEEHKAYLKDKNICFTVCVSTLHRAEDCERPVRCYECESNRHIFALHTGPAPVKKSPLPTMQTKAQGFQHLRSLQNAQKLNM